MTYPFDVIWYIEARLLVAPAHAPEKACMGSAIAVHLEGTDGNPAPPRKYLLTCGHVVRNKAMEGNPDSRTGWGRQLGEILCFRPGKGYFRTVESGRISGVHPGIHGARVSELSPCGGIADEVPEHLRVPMNDWVLLDVYNEEFQAFPAVSVWGNAVMGSSFDLVGYPGGAGSSAHPNWNNTDSVRVSRGTFALQRQSENPAMLLLDGDHSRPGMSGGGVFSAKGTILVGMHRAATDGAFARHSISADYIREDLRFRRKLRAVPYSTPPPSPAPDSTSHRPRNQVALKAIEGFKDMVIQVANGPFPPPDARPSPGDQA